MIAESTFPAAQALVDACAISAGQEVLDVAAGNGNLALLAAREGAAVVASDLTPGDGRARIARARAAEGYDVEWLVADVEELPFEDGRFDCCASVFGAMFAPRPDVAAAEMFRVVRPGGTVGLVVVDAGGLPGQGLRGRQQVRAIRRGSAGAGAVGRRGVARERLSGTGVVDRLRAPLVRHEFESPEGWFEFSRNAGPTQGARPVAARRRAPGDDATSSSR